MSLSSHRERRPAADRSELTDSPLRQVANRTTGTNDGQFDAARRTGSQWVNASMAGSVERSPEDEFLDLAADGEVHAPEFGTLSVKKLFSFWTRIWASASLMASKIGMDGMKSSAGAASILGRRQR